MANESGFDMKNTIGWYKNSGVAIPEISLSETLPFPVEEEHLIGLSREEMAGLFNLFPKNARQRCVVKKIIGQPVTYFHRESTSENQIPTNNASEAISSTALIPSYIDYGEWRQTGIPAGDIWMYKLPEEIPEDVRRIISAEGFAHELGHGIAQSALFKEDYKLQFPDGKIVDGLDAMFEFATLAENHEPISHYAGSFRKDFKSSDAMNVKRAISEEAAETIAAYFLGFAYCGDDKRSRNPFEDRPEIKEFMRNFLEARKVG